MQVSAVRFIWKAMVTAIPDLAETHQDVTAKRVGHHSPKEIFNLDVTP